MNRRIGVHPGDNVHELFLGCIFRKRNGAGTNAQAGGALERCALIGQIVGARAHAHNRKTGLHAALFKRSNAPFQFLSQRVNNRLSKQQFRHDGSFFFCGIRSMEPTLTQPKNTPRLSRGKLRQKTMPVTFPRRALWIHTLSAII